MAKGDISNEYFYEISPARHTKDFHVPMLLIHGEDDQIVPVKQSRRMYKNLGGWTSKWSL